MAQPSPENLILVDVEPNGIASVTINCPKSLNSLTKAMMTDLAQAFKALDRNDGEGRFQGRREGLGGGPGGADGAVPEADIGAVNGFAVTAGFEIALACDILIAAKGAKFIDTHARFGIFPSWGLSQKLSRIIGPNKAREVSLTATPLTAEVAERLGVVNHVVEEGQLLNKVREVAEAIIRNNQDLVLRYKAVINDGLKLDLGHALSLEKERAHDYYNGMTKEQFKKMQEFKAGRGSKKPSSKL
ncbi:3-hydroxybutyryl-CoA dehydratase [Morus notabilis]|uniref:3-hydroxybutyryl-CoA dehydratase n=1 Tax=Morus notabilis TaxID=981085 RepID=W9S3Z6_9ROSA|nr:3-hydroxybutyryl-CoA dehydratase [Morus notabilis]